MVTLSYAGLVIQVDETRALSVVAYIPSAIFDRYSFRPPRGNASPTQERHSSPTRLGNDNGQTRALGKSIGNDQGEYEDEMDEDDDDVAFPQFEMNLSVFNEMINIYGHAVGLGGLGDDASSSTGKRRFGMDDSVDPLEYFGNARDHTSMIMRWPGEGHPLEMTL